MKLWTLTCWAILAAPAQESISQLAEIKTRVAANQERLPNYTCTETIERSRRRADSRKFRPLDRVRLEVALVDNKELFGWPGGDRIAEDEITHLVSGTIGNGDFALLERAVFFTPDAVLGPPLAETFSDRAVLPYEYRVPLAASGYHLRVPPKDALVAYHGTFWVDAQSLELQRLEVIVDAIPPFLGISAASNTVEFASVEIGGTSFRLPRQTELRITDQFGRENRNQTTFQNCHEFKGESVLKFVDEGTEIASAAVAEETVRPVSLPEIFSLDLALNGNIDARTAAIGDPVSAVLEQPLRAPLHAHGEVLAPKGAIVRGRIDDIEHGETGFRIRFIATSLEFQKTRIDLTARVNQLSRAWHTDLSIGLSSAPAERPEP
ncbi:MAG TPA: hypothetical protein VKG25_20635, partial [Bryobacteraceae bacterium]|nr:hypothetical protein [Bryobacteraceae bacterium]